MNCCKSKPKPTTANTTTVTKPISTLQPVQPIAQPTFTTNFQPNNSNLNGTFSPNASGISGTMGSTLRVPKAKVAYSGQDYDTTTLNNQSQFMTANKVTHFVQDRQDRVQSYAQQLNKANQSRLLTSKDLLTYKLDGQNGVSKIPIINTFDYFSSLSHLTTPIGGLGLQRNNSYNEQLNRINSSQNLNNFNPNLTNSQSNLNYANNNLTYPNSNINYANNNLNYNPGIVNPQSNLNYANNNLSNSQRLSGNLQPNYNYDSKLFTQGPAVVSGLNNQYNNVSTSGIQNTYNPLNRASGINNQHIYNNDYTVNQQFIPSNTVYTPGGNLPTNTSNLAQPVSNYVNNNTSGIRNTGTNQYNAFNNRISGIQNTANNYANTYNNTASGIRNTANNELNNYNNAVSGVRDSGIKVTY